MPNILQDSDYKKMWLHLQESLEKLMTEKHMLELQEQMDEKDSYIVMSTVETVRRVMTDLEETVVKTNTEAPNKEVIK